MFNGARSQIVTKFVLTGVRSDERHRVGMVESVHGPGRRAEREHVPVLESRPSALGVVCASVNDDDVYKAAEQLRETQPFNAQDVAEQMLESDVGGVLESLHRLVEAGRLRLFKV